MQLPGANIESGIGYCGVDWQGHMYECLYLKGRARARIQKDQSRQLLLL